MIQQGSLKPHTRLIYIDHLRIYLTVLVILHHNAIAYSGSGPWGVLDPGADAVSSMLFMIFTTVNQSYFMSVFFLLAGYFTPRSLENKGTAAFLIDRLVRLVIPILVYITLIVNINEYILDLFVNGTPFDLQFGYNVGHLWFLQALLVFSLIYVVYKAIRTRSGSISPSQVYRDRLPPDRVLIASIVVLGTVTFGVRLVFPVGNWHFGIQPGHFAAYIFSFYAGIQAYRGDWFDRLSGVQARRWGLAVIFIFLALLVMIVLGGVLEGGENLAKFEGGLHWQAFAYSMWESAMLVGIVVFLIHLFREKFYKGGTFTRFLAANTFTVYIIHQTVLYLVQSLGLAIHLPAVIKFVLAAVIAIPLCFFLSALLRKIPYAKRVLG